jgi:hypothetical protein
MVSSRPLDSVAVDEFSGVLGHKHLQYKVQFGMVQRNSRKVHVERQLKLKLATKPLLLLHQVRLQARPLQ